LSGKGKPSQRETKEKGRGGEEGGDLFAKERRREASNSPPKKRGQRPERERETEEDRSHRNGEVNWIPPLHEGRKGKEGD